MLRKVNISLKLIHHVTAMNQNWNLCNPTRNKSANLIILSLYTVPLGGINEFICLLYRYALHNDIDNVEGNEYCVSSQKSVDELVAPT
jgi:hypothetical protein